MYTYEKLRNVNYVLQMRDSEKEKNLLDNPQNMED